MSCSLRRCPLISHSWQERMEYPLFPPTRDQARCSATRNSIIAFLCTPNGLMIPHSEVTRGTVPRASSTDPL